MLDSVALRLADCLHPAGLVLDVHVVEGHVQEVDAEERREIITGEISDITEFQTPHSKS